MCNYLVSIVIPCFNNGHLLSKMIDSVIRQTYIKWELIIVDDCSSDNTPNVVLKFAKKDKRIKFFIRDRAPKGAQTCRNIGMSNSDGEFIMIFDADDLISDTCLEKRVEFMKNNPDIDYASFPARSFTNEEQLPSFLDKGKKYGVGDDKTDILSCLLKTDYSVIVWTNIYRRLTILNIKWDERVKVYQDFDFAVSVIFKGLIHKFSNSKEIDYFYRRSDCENTTSSNYVSTEKCDSTIYLFSKTLNKLKLRSDFKKRRKEFKHFIVLQFKRLVIDGNKKKVYDFLNFCKKYYNVSYIKLFIICILAICIKNITIRKILLNFLICILFFRKKTITKVSSTLKKTTKMIIKK
ncbi:MAG: glycosyltransferase family 2 protein [Marinilabiliaceae bacterium]|nr:glycosyltransferase family 2 protein [Marinilabiliaceae bacterium]